MLQEPKKITSEKFLGFLATCWASPQGVIFFCFVLWVCGYAELLYKGKHFDSWITFAESIIAPTVTGALWAWQNRLPTVNREKMGVVMAIVSEDDSEAKRINADFVDEVRKLLANDKACQKFEVKVLSGYWASEIAKSRKRVAEVLTKMGASVMFYGTARRRIANGKDTHVLSLEVALRHAPINAEASKQIAAEMTAALPGKVLVPVDGDFAAFEATSKWIGLGAKYLAAISSGLARNFAYGEELFLDIETKLTGSSEAAPALQPLAKAVPKNLIWLYDAWSGCLCDEYYLRRDTAVLQEAARVCDKILARNPERYELYLVKSMAAFLPSRDIKAARKYSTLGKKAVNGKDATALYNLAFLSAYEGKLEEAHELYRKAFRRVAFNATIPLQSEEFIHLVMQEEPQKKFLHFCTGLINYNGKSDFGAAAVDFEVVLSLASPEITPWVRKKAEEMLALCRSKLISGTGG